MDSILKGIKCFVRNVNKSFLKEILFFGQQGRFRAFLAAGDI
jgi:hypothetical protein